MWKCGNYNHYYLFTKDKTKKSPSWLSAYDRHVHYYIFLSYCLQRDGETEERYIALMPFCNQKTIYSFILFSHIQFFYKRFSPRHPDYTQHSITFAAHLFSSANQVYLVVCHSWAIDEVTIHYDVYSWQSVFSLIYNIALCLLRNSDNSPDKALNLICNMNITVTNKRASDREWVYRPQVKYEINAKTGWLGYFCKVDKSLRIRNVTHLLKSFHFSSQLSVLDTRNKPINMCMNNSFLWHYMYLLMQQSVSTYSAV